MLQDGIIIDGLRWVIGEHPPKAIPLCPKDFVGLNPYPTGFELSDENLKCEDCGTIYPLKRTVNHEKEYVLSKINSKIYKSKRFINLDDEAIPIAEDKISKNSEYFVSSVLTKSKVGLRLVVFAGKKGSSKKTEIFVEPDIKRLAFDQKDLHPNDIFASLEATFADNSKASITKKPCK